MNKCEKCLGMAGEKGLFPNAEAAEIEDNENVGGDGEEFYVWGTYVLSCTSFILFVQYCLLVTQKTQAIHPWLFQLFAVSMIISMGNAVLVCALVVNFSRHQRVIRKTWGKLTHLIHTKLGLDSTATSKHEELHELLHVEKKGYNTC